MGNFINDIEITNFKSIRHQKIEGCRRVNVFIGYPNVGKSNILEALGLYSIPLIFDNERFTLDNICRLKYKYGLFYDNQYKNDVTINLNNTVTLSASYQNDNLLFRIKDTVKDLIVSEFATGIGSNGLGFQHIGTSNLPASIKKYQFSNGTTFFSSNSLSLSLPFGRNLIDVLKTNSALRKDVADIFKTYKVKIRLDEGTNEIVIQKDIDEEFITSIPYMQIADTLQRLIFYKAAIMSNENSVLLFEEPEAHMFPPYISSLVGDILFDKNNNQFFISTHSPFVINDLIEDLKDNELSIYAVGLRNGETTIKRITDEEVTEIYQYGIDLFFNLESYLKND